MDNNQSTYVKVLDRMKNQLIKKPTQESQQSSSRKQNQIGLTMNYRKEKQDIEGMNLSRRIE
jgi:hypothetical protein